MCEHCIRRCQGAEGYEEACKTVHAGHQCSRRWANAGRRDRRQASASTNTPNDSCGDSDDAATTSSWTSSAASSTSSRRRKEKKQRTGCKTPWSMRGVFTDECHSHPVRAKSKDMKLLSSKWRKNENEYGKWWSGLLPAYNYYSPW